MQSLGQLVDQISTINNKTFIAQEEIYKIRRMTWDQFQDFVATDDGLRNVYDMIKKSCDLNVQRSYAVTEFDKKLVDLIRGGIAGSDLDDGCNIQEQHKTY